MAFPSIHNLDSKVKLSLPHNFNIEDILATARVGDPVLSPDGHLIAVSVRKWNGKNNKWTANIYVVPVDGSAAPKKLTSAVDRSDDSPVWLNDCKRLIFLSTRSGSRQLYVISINGGEATAISGYSVDIESFKLNARNDALVFQAQVYPVDEDDVLGKTAAMLKAKAENPTEPTGTVYSKLMVRHWDTMFTGVRAHLFLQSLQVTADSVSLAGPVTDLLRGLDTDAPPRPFGGAESYDWSASGTELAYCARPPVQPTGHSEATATTMHIYRVLLSSSRAVTTCVTPENRSGTSCPLYSPSGRTLAFLMQMRPGYESDRYRIVLYDTATAQSRVLTEQWDRQPASIAWSGEDRIFVVAAETGRERIFVVDALTGEATTVVQDHFNSALSVSAKNLVFGRDALTLPREIFASDLDGSNITQLTHFNTDQYKLVQWSQPEELWFAGADGDRIHAWFLKPADYREGQKYPLVVLIHGGPQGAWDDHFHYRWNPQIYAAAGYAVVAINPHGSTGYGQKFTDAVCKNWGGAPFDDIMGGLQHTLTTYPWIDPDRVGALGASYGGYMINWINGHTQQFKCLVNHDGLFDLRNAYYTTEELWFSEWEMGATPYETGGVFDRWNPAAHVDKWTTPTLVIHSAKDYRVCDTDGIATFTALQRRGVPSKLLYFPDENHWVLQPRNSRLWHVTVLEWLETYLKH